MTSERVSYAPDGLELVGRPAVRELVPTTPSSTGRWHVHDYPGPWCRWNYHPEYEVHLIRSGSGRFVVGDHVGTFRAGQVVLVGSNLPHNWISDLDPGERLEGRDVVFQFHPQWFEDCLALLPELSAVAPLLRRARRGIEFLGSAAERAAEQLCAIGTSTGVARIERIIGLLDVLATAPAEQTRSLATPWVPPGADSAGTEWIDQVLTVLAQNTDPDLRMATVAAHVGLSESAFSRAFVRATGQTYTETLAKLRIARACQLLEQTDRPVSQIAEQTGYHNLSNFNRRFLARQGLTPTQYRRQARAA